jgi:hypothetical protein
LCSEGALVAGAVAAVAVAAMVASRLARTSSSSSTSAILLLPPLPPLFTFEVSRLDGIELHFKSLFRRTTLHEREDDGDT